MLKKNTHQQITKKRHRKLWWWTTSSLGILVLSGAIGVTQSATVQVSVVKHNQNHAMLNVLPNQTNGNTTTNLTSYLGQKYLINTSLLNQWNQLKMSNSSQDAPAFMPKSQTFFNTSLPQQTTKTSISWNGNQMSANGTMNNTYLAPVGAYNMQHYQTWFVNWLNANQKNQFQTYEKNTLSTDSTWSANNNESLVQALMNRHFLVANPSIGTIPNASDNELSALYNTINTTPNNAFTWEDYVYQNNDFNSAVRLPNINNFNLPSMSFNNAMQDNSSITSPLPFLQVNPLIINAMYNMSLFSQTFMQIAQFITGTSFDNPNASSSNSSNIYPQFGSSAGVKDIQSGVILANWSYLAFLVYTGAVTSVQQFEDINNAINGFTPKDNANLSNLMNNGNNGSASARQYFCPQAYIDLFNPENPNTFNWLSALQLTNVVNANNAMTLTHCSLGTWLVNTVFQNVWSSNTFPSYIDPSFSNELPFPKPLTITQTVAGKTIPLSGTTFDSDAADLTLTLPANSDYTQNNYTFTVYANGKEISPTVNTTNQQRITGLTITSKQVNFHQPIVLKMMVTQLSPQKTSGFWTVTLMPNVIVNTHASLVWTPVLVSGPFTNTPSISQTQILQAVYQLLTTFNKKLTPTNNNLSIVTNNAKDTYTTTYNTQTKTIFASSPASQLVQSNAIWSLPVGSNDSNVKIVQTPSWFNTVLNAGITPTSYFYLTQGTGLVNLAYTLNFSYIAQVSSLSNSVALLDNQTNINTSAFFRYSIGQMLYDPLSNVTNYLMQLSPDSLGLYSFYTGADSVNSNNAYNNANNILEGAAINYTFWSLFNIKTTKLNFEMGSLLGDLTSLVYSAFSITGTSASSKLATFSSLGVNPNWQYLGSQYTEFFPTGAVNDNVTMTVIQTSLPAAIMVNFKTLPVSYLVTGAQINSWSYTSQPTLLQTSNTGILWDQILQNIHQQNNDVLYYSTTSGFLNTTQASVTGNSAWETSNEEPIAPSNLSYYNTMYFPKTMQTANVYNPSLQAQTSANFQTFLLGSLSFSNSVYDNSATYLQTSLTNSLNIILNTLVNQTSYNMNLLYHNAVLNNDQNLTTLQNLSVQTLESNQSVLLNNKANFYTISNALTTRYIIQNGRTNIQRMPYTPANNFATVLGINDNTQNQTLLQTITNSNVATLTQYQQNLLATLTHKLDPEQSTINSQVGVVTTNSQDGYYVGLLPFTNLVSVQNGQLHTPDVAFALYNLSYTTQTSAVNNNAKLNVTDIAPLAALTSADAKVTLQYNVHDFVLETNNTTIANLDAILNAFLAQNQLQTNYSQNTLASFVNNNLLKLSDLQTTPSTLSFNLSFPNVTYPAGLSAWNGVMSAPITFTITGFHQIVGASPLNTAHYSTVHQNEANENVAVNHLTMWIIDASIAFAVIIAVCGLVGIGFKVMAYIKKQSMRRK